MTVETETKELEGQALWDDVAKERGADEQSPSTTATDAEVKADEPESEAQETTESQATTETDGSKKDEPTAKTEEAPDPYAGLSPELKQRLQRLEALESQVPQLAQRVDAAVGRVAAWQREKDVAKQAATAVKNAPTQAQINAAAASTDKWDTLKTDFPEWADATEQYVAAKLAGMTPQQVQQVDPDKIAEVIEQRVGQVRAEMARAVEEAKVEGRHPNWREDINSDGFVKWFGVQTPEVKALAASDKGRDAIRMLDLYQEALAKPADKVQQERANKLAAAVSAKPGAGAGAVKKTVDDMSPEELWNYEAKLAVKRRGSSGLTY